MNPARIFGRPSSFEPTPRMIQVGIRKLHAMPVHATAMKVWEHFRTLDPDSIQAVTPPTRRPAPASARAPQHKPKRMAMSAEYQRLLMAEQESKDFRYNAHQRSLREGQQNDRPQR